MEALVDCMTKEKAASQTIGPAAATLPGQVEAMDCTFPTNDKDLTASIATNSTVEANGNDDNRPLAPQSASGTTSSPHTDRLIPATSSVKTRYSTTDPGFVDGAPMKSTHDNYTNTNLNCDDIIKATLELTSKLEKITLADYERTMYIGMSAGVHLLHQGLFSSNSRHHIKEMPSWYVQKVNNDEEEHILIKSAALKTPPSQHNYVDRTSVFTINIPHIQQDRIDIIIQA